MSIIYSVRRNRFLLNCAENKLSYSEICLELHNNHLEEIREEEWNLWLNYYHPLTYTNPVYRHELVYNNRTLSWFARNLADRYTKTSLS